jgi:hypothetical protein
VVGGLVVSIIALRIPYYLSTGWLRVYPTFQALRRNPRFERLIAAR